jgi:hypothetical protein
MKNSNGIPEHIQKNGLTAEAHGAVNFMAPPLVSPCRARVVLRGVHFFVRDAARSNAFHRQLGRADDARRIAQGSPDHMDGSPGNFQGVLRQPFAGRFKYPLPRV